MKQLNGQELAGFIKERQAKQVRALRQAWKVFPRLAIVTDNNSPVIETYIRLKQKYGADILIDVEIHQVESSQVLDTVNQLNSRSDVQGIIVQLPLTDQSLTEQVLAAVSPEKDVDGLNPQTKFEAATPTAINWLLAGYSIDLKSKKIAIVGRGRLVGAPLENMWQRSGHTVKVFEKGDSLDELINYDLIVSAAGSPGVIKSQYIKPGAVIVDAGTASEDGKIHGDVDEEVRQRQDVTITPKKGGVGPLTVTALFDNLITACLKIAQADQ